MSDIFVFFGQLSDLWHHLVSLRPVHVFFPHLSVLMHRTWPIALIGWFGVSLLVRSTGRIHRWRSDIRLGGAVWALAMLMYSRLGLQGAAIVHVLSFSFLTLGCMVWIISTVGSASYNRRYWRA